MERLKERWKRPGIRLAILALMVVGVYFLSIFVKQSWNLYTLRREVRVREARVAELEKVNQGLRNEWADKSAPGGQEDLVKSNLPFKKKGERLIILVRQEATVSAAPVGPSQSGPSLAELTALPTWRQWVRVVFPPALAAGP